LLPLDPGEYLAGPANHQRLLKNISALRAYAEGLELTVICYEKQQSLSSKGVT
jgi:hypothetical protein